MGNLITKLTELYPTHNFELKAETMYFITMDGIDIIQIPCRRADRKIPLRLHDAILEHLKVHINSTVI